MMKKNRRKLTLMLALTLLLTLTIPMAAQAGESSRAAMEAYWRIVGNPQGADALTRAMNGEQVPLQALTAVTADELMAFAAANELPVNMARYGWYIAMANILRAQPETLTGSADTRATLTLFLSMPETFRDKSLNAERRTLRRGMTQDDILRLSRETGLPAGFIAWVALDDEWHEEDWEDVDDWREGRSSWIFADHAYEREFRERYGKAAVVTDDDVERVLRQNGLRFDD